MYSGIVSRILSAYFFRTKKKKPGSFLARKIFAGPGDPEFF